MISIPEAFLKFKSRLELTQGEREDASRRQNRIRELLRTQFEIDRDILTGSYSRHTKTKPLKDVDILCILASSESHRKNQSPAALLDAFKAVLAKGYGATNVNTQRRSVEVNFDVTAIDDDSGEQVMAFDVVPAFAVNGCYQIPDVKEGTWIKTNPEVHRRLATEANDALSLQWVPMVKMIKKWNQTNGKPVSPSFLLEVMALEIFTPEFSGGYPYELKSFFATAAEQIGRVWPDPAGLGPPVSDQMDSARIQKAQKAFLLAEQTISTAQRFERDGRAGDALREWRRLFGPLFPLS
jgi:hypothetical protein